MNKRIATLQVGHTVWDKVVKGLHVRALSSKKSYMLYYRTKAGVERRPKIGDVGQISIAEARRRAKLLLDRVAVGEDPKGEWDLQRAEVTLTDLFQLCWKKHWNTERFIQSGWAREVEKYYSKNIQGEFGAQKISSIESKDVKAWHLQLSSSPYSANRSLEVLSKLFGFAEEMGLVPRGTNPCWNVKAFTEKKRSRYATESEIKLIGQLLGRESLKDPRGVAFIYLMLYTGCRPRALQSARRDELKRVTNAGRAFGVLSFKGKTSADSGELERVLIPPVVLEMIDGLEPAADGTLLGCKMPRKLWNRIRQEIGSPDLWARDLRRTFATTALSNGIPIGAISELLNHKSQQTTKIYAKLMHNSGFNAVGAIADSINEILRPPSGS